MNPEESPTNLERALAALLLAGTWLASLVIALGLVIAVGSPEAGTRIASAGILLFIALPVARVATMLIFFARAREYRFSAIAALVLAIIFSSYLIGAH